MENSFLEAEKSIIQLRWDAIVQLIGKKRKRVTNTRKKWLQLIGMSVINLVYMFNLEERFLCYF